MTHYLAGVRRSLPSRRASLLSEDCDAFFLRAAIGWFVTVVIGRYNMRCVILSLLIVFAVPGVASKACWRLIA
jgi:hypothetical protein